MGENKNREKRILVVGDIMLDSYLYGQVKRISPEGPIPILTQEKEQGIAGGAANVACNLSSNQIGAHLIGVIGNDLAGIELKAILEKKGVNTKFVITDTDRPTTVKTRFISGGQQIFRYDKEWTSSIDVEIEEKLFQFVKNHITEFDVLVLSDYAKGFLTIEVTEKIILLAKEYGVPTLVDPKGCDYKKYKGCTLIKPNKKELDEFVGISGADEPYEKKALRLKEALESRYVVITLGAEGILFVDENNTTHCIQGNAKQVYDVTGAGDTVLAFLAMGFDEIGLSLEAVNIANEAAGIKVGKLGTASVTYKEIAENRDGNKIKNKEEVPALIEYLNANDRKVGFTNGCFDILHAGHVMYLQKAKETVDVLIVGLNTDTSVKKLKGKERPIQNENERAFILSALECVDYIVLFEEETPLDLIMSVKPDVLIKGGDYKIEEIIGYDFVKARGGEVLTIPLLEGKSTTNLIEKMWRR